MPLEGLTYCTRCCMPETQEGTSMDKAGICRACTSSEDKMRINWSARRHELSLILEEARARGAKAPYDCLVPISGGKDSLFQLHVLTQEFGMRPLAATFSHNWFSTVGLYNLLNAIEQMDVDHVMFTPRRSLVNQLARASLSAIGDSCWHCHAGVGAFPLKVAVDYQIPLIIWGESIAETSGRSTYRAPGQEFDRDYFLRVSAKVAPSELAEEYSITDSLEAFEPPSQEKLDELDLVGIHLGDYIFWDDERQTEFVKRHYGWHETEMEGTYKRYKSAECTMPGVHDFTCYLKRGYGRATSQASIDVRAGMVRRDEAMESLVDLDRVEPAQLDVYLELANLTREEFFSIMYAHRHESIRGISLPITPANPARRPPETALDGLKRALGISEVRRKMGQIPLAIEDEGVGNAD